METGGPPSFYHRSLSLVHTTHMTLSYSSRNSHGLSLGISSGNRNEVKFFAVVWFKSWVRFFTFQVFG